MSCLSYMMLSNELQCEISNSCPKVPDHWSVTKLYIYNIPFVICSVNYRSEISAFGLSLRGHITPHLSAMAIELIHSAMSW